jgi:hypothetical protein
MPPKAQSKLIPEAELNEIMLKAEQLWKKLYKPKSAYSFYTKDAFQKARAGEAGAAKGLAAIGARWNELSSAEKKKFEDMHEADKAKAAEMQNNYDAYMQKVGPRLLDHDEEVEVAELAEKKNEVEQRYRSHQKRSKEERIQQSAFRSKPRTRKMAKGTQDVREVRSRGAPVEAEMRRLSLADGLDPRIWEVRESRTKPGMFYYYNKVEKMTQVSKPQVMASASKRLRSKSAPGSSISGKTPRRVLSA